MNMISVVPQRYHRVRGRSELHNCALSMNEVWFLRGRQIHWWETPYLSIKNLRIAASIRVFHDPSSCHLGSAAMMSPGLKCETVYTSMQMIMSFEKIQLNKRIHNCALLMKEVWFLRGRQIHWWETPYLSMKNLRIAASIRVFHDPSSCHLGSAAMMSPGLKCETVYSSMQMIMSFEKIQLNKRILCHYTSQLKQYIMVQSFLVYKAVQYHTIFKTAQSVFQLEIDAAWLALDVNFYHVKIKLVLSYYMRVFTYSAMHNHVSCWFMERGLTGSSFNICWNICSPAASFTELQKFIIPEAQNPMKQITEVCSSAVVNRQCEVLEKTRGS